MTATISATPWREEESSPASLATPAVNNPTAYDAALYKQRNVIERMFGRIKDWRRIATRYDRRARIFSSAIYTLATIIFRL